MSIKPYYYLAEGVDGAGGGGSAASTGETFDYTKIASARDTIEGAIEAAIKAIQTGSSAIESGFGGSGSAMSGGGSNNIATRWDTMTDRINGFAALIKKELDNLGVVSTNNQSLEQQVADLFSSLGNSGE